MKISITYPPDYDGELWIEATKKSVNKTFSNVTFEFTMSCKPEETEEDVLLRAANDIIKCLMKRLT